MSFQEESRLYSDSVRPGEQWFFYWKTSAALWEHRIREFAPHEIIFIPLHWGFHAESAGSWDFGKFHPERDLPRLIKLLTQHGRRFCWLLPLTPAPFLPNGGLPITCARTLSLSRHGMHLSCLDSENTLHKMYSFFEPKVFQSFASFVQSFAEVLAQTRCQSPVWGAEFSYRDDHKQISFLQDSSVAFEQGFSRYLKKNHPQGVELKGLAEEHKLKATFEHDVSSLFQSLAGESLAPFWSGTQSITTFGASPRDTIERALSAGKSQVLYFKELFESYVNHQWFSTALLSPTEKKDLLKKCLKEHFGSEEIEYQFNYLPEGSDLGADFRPHSLVDVFEQHSLETFRKNGLVRFLDTDYRWMYYLHSEMVFNPKWIDSGQHRVKFFHAEGMDRTLFGQMLKLFMMGHKIVLDRSKLSEDLDRRLQVFFLENNLKIQSVKFLTPVTICQLGEGCLITVEGELLKEPKDQDKFWSQIFKFLNLDNPKIFMEEGIFSLWRIRATSPHELNYLDVRRVNLYNPTSYKKSVTVHTQKKFAFMKVIDPLHSQAKTTPEGVEVELLPNGKVALDFGHYEEN